MRLSPLLALGLVVPSTLAQQPSGTFKQVGNTLVSAMMMFVGGTNKVYILDKSENNPTQINGHAAWGAVWDINNNVATPLDVVTNTFCAAGMHLPNGSFAVFGGNSAVGLNQGNGAGSTPQFDPIYEDYDGRKAIRIVTPCEGDPTQAPCAFYDAANGPRMAAQRWYPGAEPLADGTIVLIGGLAGGGYINRHFPNVDPINEGGDATPSYEFWPPRAGNLQIMQFLVKTSGLNAYALTYLMPSGKMFVQANYSTILWDYNTNVETPLPDMPGQIVRVYPASGANAMLPLTPANGYVPTILFCGGTTLPDQDWGDYNSPFGPVWTVGASQDCHRITPEPADGSVPAYVQDDNLPVGRTMGQFIALPDGTMLLLNGAQYGTAGYAQTGQTPAGQVPYGQSLATGPVLTPVIYNPNAPVGSRFSSAGLTASQIPRMYHSSAVLLPDGSVMVAGSNPNADVTVGVQYPTTWAAEYFYPSYFSAATRPAPQGVPTTLYYGGTHFDITITPASYTGSVNTAAAASTIWLMRQGFTTHAMNMGQRSMQLNTTYTIYPNGTYVIHSAQLPPNPNLFQPGPAYLYVTINGIPSTGTYVIVGNGQFGVQPTYPKSVLPASGNAVTATSSSAGSSSTSKSNNKNGATSHAVAGSMVSLLLVATVVLLLS